MNTLIPLQIDPKILNIRGQRVLLDTDLAEIYGVTTKRLNEQVKRNPERFPSDFMFQLSPAEKQEVVANCDHLQRLKFSKATPFAFTELAAKSLSNITPCPLFTKDVYFGIQPTHEYHLHHRRV